jgi:hypothetical protein
LYTAAKAWNQAEEFSTLDSNRLTPAFQSGAFYPATLITIIVVDGHDLLHQAFVFTSHF